MSDAEAPEDDIPFTPEQILWSDKLIASRNPPKPSSASAMSSSGSGEVAVTASALLGGRTGASGSLTTAASQPGYGKSIIYSLLPFVFDKIRGTSGSIVLCVSPLTSIMMDQRAKFIPRGLKTEFIGEAQTDVEAKKMVLKGEVQLLFISPESIINNLKYRKMLFSMPYKSKLVAFAVDEAHCVKMWGDQFRIAIAEIVCVRSIVPTNVRMMALTATATHETLRVVTQRLAMNNPALIALPPHRDNISYKMQTATSLDELRSVIIRELAEK